MKVMNINGCGNKYVAWGKKKLVLEVEHAVIQLCR